MVAKHNERTKFETYIEDQYGKGKFVLIWGAKDKTCDLDVQCFKTGGLSRPNTAILVECKDKENTTLDDFEKFVRRLKIFARKYEGASYRHKFADNPLLTSTRRVADTERRGVFYYTGELDETVGDCYLNLPRDDKNMIRIQKISI